MRLGYRPALDGLRAVAILLVLWHHSVAVLDLPALTWVLGGFLGVDVFFVLSGFLITTLLHERWTGSFGETARAFYWRRAVRLLPALLVFLAVHAVVARSLHDDLGTELRTAGAALAYITNLASSFDWTLAGDQVHLWSLAVEEQFYLVWPLALAFLVRLRSRTALWVLGGAVVLVVVWRWTLMRHLGSGYPVAYERPDARADALLIGAALAWIVRGGWRPSVRTATALGLGGSGLLAAMVLRVRADGDFLYYGGFTLVALAAAAVIVGLLVAGGPLERTLSWRPLVGLGRVSYSLYLWHVLAYRLAVELVPEPTVARVAAANGAALACAVVSFHCIERPFVSGWQEVPRPLRAGARVLAASLRRPALPQVPSGAVVAALAAVVLLVGGSGAGVAAQRASERRAADEAAGVAAPPTSTRADASAPVAGAVVDGPAPVGVPAPTVVPTTAPPASDAGGPVAGVPPATTRLVVTAPVVGPGGLGGPVTVVLAATLSTEGGSPLAGRSLRLALVDVDEGECRAVTDERGVGSCSVALAPAVVDPPTVDDLAVAATFDGDPEATAATAAWPTVGT